MQSPASALYETLARRYVGGAFEDRLASQRDLPQLTFFTEALMTISESDRRDIYVGLEEVLGPEIANNLLAMLPNQPAAQLVTRDDMHANTIMLRGEMGELRGEMAELRAELKGDMADLRGELRGEMGELRSELRGEMGELRSELRGEMGELRSDVRNEIAALRVSTQRWMSGAVAANTIAVVTALVT